MISQFILPGRGILLCQFLLFILSSIGLWLRFYYNTLLNLASYGQTSYYLSLRPVYCEVSFISISTLLIESCEVGKVLSPILKTRLMVCWGKGNTQGRAGKPPKVSTRFAWLQRQHFNFFQAERDFLISLALYGHVTKQGDHFWPVHHYDGDTVWTSTVVADWVERQGPGPSYLDQRARWTWATIAEWWGLLLKCRISEESKYMGRRLMTEETDTWKRPKIKPP